MANSFEDREKGFEGKAKLEEDALFKLNARAVRLFGLWAAEQLGLKGAEADAYAETVIDSDFEEPGNEDVLRKVGGDFKARGLNFSAEQLDKQFDLKLEEARKK